MNQGVHPLVMGCVTYRVDGNSAPVTERFVYDIDANCADGKACQIYGDHVVHGGTTRIDLVNAME